MSIELKIHRGTGRLTDANLCDSCTYSMRWVDSRGDHLKCAMFSTESPEAYQTSKVTECSVYYNKNLPSVRDFEQIAWVVRTDNSGKVRGFQPPEPKDSKPDRPSRF